MEHEWTHDDWCNCGLSQYEPICLVNGERPYGLLIIDVPKTEKIQPTA